jgi:hypothetical protein
MDSEKSIPKERISIPSSCTLCPEPMRSKKPINLCQNCLKPACLLHSKTITSNTICENCLKQSFKAEFSSHSRQISSLQKKLQDYLLREEHLKKEISLKQLKQSSLESLLSSNQINHDEKAFTLAQKISEESSKTLKQESIKTELSSLLSKSETNIQNLIISLSTSQTSILKLSTSLKRSEQELQPLNSHLLNLLSNCDSQVSYRRLRNLTCNKCHFLIKSKLKETLLQVLDPRTSDSLLTSLFEKSPEKLESREETPCVCELF